VGEKVLAYNPSTKKMELQPILHVWINHDNDLVDLTITHPTKPGKETSVSSEVIHTNKKHPFLTVEKGFLPVAKINLGMHVVEASGQVGVITGWKVVPGIKVMYNLEVALDHTFVVGVGMWVVHNSACPAGLDQSEPVVVIGRNMADRVRVYAEELRNEGFDVRTYKPRSDPPTLDANASWLRYWAKEKGAQVVDIGPVPKAGPGDKSPYYEMEQHLLKLWGTKVFNHDPGY
jgi:Pretoxin HINT domain